MNKTQLSLLKAQIKLNKLQKKINSAEKKYNNLLSASLVSDLLTYNKQYELYISLKLKQEIDRKNASEQELEIYKKIDKKAEELFNCGTPFNEVGSHFKELNISNTFDKNYSLALIERFLIVDMEDRLKIHKSVNTSEMHRKEYWARQAGFALERAFDEYNKQAKQFNEMLNNAIKNNEDVSKFKGVPVYKPSHNTKDKYQTHYAFVHIDALSRQRIKSLSEKYKHSIANQVK